MPKIMIMAASSPSPCGRGLGGGGTGRTNAPSPQPPPARGGGERAPLSCLADELAVAFAQRPVRIGARRRRYQLVVVPRPLAFRGLLHLEQTGWRQIAAVLADRRLAEAVVVDRQLLHAC